MSSTPSDYVLTPANARTPSRQDGPRISSRTRIRNEVVEEAARPVASGSLQDLRHEIGLLSAEIDAFSAERGAVKKMLAEARIQVRSVVNSSAYTYLVYVQSRRRGDPPRHTNLQPQKTSSWRNTPQSRLQVMTRASGKRSINSPPTVRSFSPSCTPRETQALRSEFAQLARQTARREREMQAEIDTLRRALAASRVQQRESPDDDETRCAAAAPGGDADSKVPVPIPIADPLPPLLPPSVCALHSPRILDLSAPRVPSPVQHPDAALDVLEAQTVDNAGRAGDDDEGRGQATEASPPGTEAEEGTAASQPGTEAEVKSEDEPEPEPEPEPEDDLGSEMDEQSMELATPLHPTILSLADDDLIIPPPMPPSLAPSTSPTATATMSATTTASASAREEELEPSDVPLPISPEGNPGLAFSPLFSSSPMHMHMHPHAGSQASASPPLLFSADIPAASSSPARVIHLDLDMDIDPSHRISESETDLLARVESATNARVAEIEREVDAVQRDLDARTRELATKNAALAQLRAAVTTAAAAAPWLHGDAGTSVPHDYDAAASADAREGEGRRGQGREGLRGGDGAREGDEDDDDIGAHGDAAVREPPGLR